MYLSNMTYASNMSNITNITISTAVVTTAEPSFFYSTDAAYYPSLFSSVAVPFFWFFAIYSISVFIVALLHLLHDTCPHLLRSTNKDEDNPATKASFKDIWRESLNRSLWNNQQYIMDVVDIITDIIYCGSIYLLVDYQIVSFVIFSAAGSLILLIAIKWLLLKYHALNNDKIWYDLIMFDLFSASLNAVQGAILFYLLYEHQLKWSVIMYIKIGVIAYQMIVKLCRGLVFCVCGKQDQYKQQFDEQFITQQLAINEANKVLSVSEEVVPQELDEEIEIESKEEEIELVTVAPVAGEEDVKEDNQEEQAAVLVDINNYGKLNETRQLLMELSKNTDLQLSERYEEEWIKNVLLLISDNQDELRNMSMKPVVKQYVKTLEKEGGDDYTRFMTLLQKANKI